MVSQSPRQRRKVSVSPDAPRKMPHIPKLDLHTRLKHPMVAFHTARCALTARSVRAKNLAQDSWRMKSSRVQNDCRRRDRPMRRNQEDCYNSARHNFDVLKKSLAAAQQMSPDEVVLRSARKRVSVKRTISCGLGAVSEEIGGDKIEAERSEVEKSQMALEDCDVELFKSQLPIIARENKMPKIAAVALAFARVVFAEIDELDHYKLSGFPKYATAKGLMAQWHADNPELVEHRVIGKSVENRDIDCYVLAAYPHAQNQAQRPRILLTSLMHAREPAGLTVVMYFYEKLLENYRRKDPEAVYLMENREIWLVPFVNPDGYIDNESQGRGRRKNTRKTCGRNEALGGVDLNRNFAYKFVKNSDYCGEEYSGSHPFSEPETLAIKELVEQFVFKSCMNFHSYGSMLTHPFNHAKKPTLPEEDQQIYNEIGKNFGFVSFGPAQLTVGYTTTGEADDWLYGEHNIISMSPEVGPENGGFWPPAHEIQGIDHRNFHRISYVVLKSGFELQEVVFRKETPQVTEIEFWNAGLSDSRGEKLFIGVLGLTRRYNPGASIINIENTVLKQHLADSEKVVTRVDQNNDYTIRDELPETLLLFKSPFFSRRLTTKYKFFGAGVEPEPRSVIFCVVENYPTTVCRCHQVTSFVAHSQHRDIQFVSPPGPSSSQATLLEKACRVTLDTVEKWVAGKTLPAPEEESGVVVTTTESQKSDVNINNADENNQINNAAEKQEVGPSPQEQHQEIHQQKDVVNNEEAKKQVENDSSERQTPPITKLDEFANTKGVEAQMKALQESYVAVFVGVVFLAFIAFLIFFGFFLIHQEKQRKQGRLNFNRLNDGEVELADVRVTIPGKPVE